MTTLRTAVEQTSAYRAIQWRTREAFQITLKTSFSALNVSDKNTEKKLPLTGTDCALMLTMVLKTYVPVADLP